MKLSHLLQIQKVSIFENRFKKFRRDIRILYPISVYQPTNRKWSPGDPINFDRHKPTTFKLRVYSKSGKVYIVLINMSECTDDGEVRVRCTCPDFGYRFMYALNYYHLLYGRVMPQGFTNKPKIRNPYLIPSICKHILRAIDDLLHHGLIIRAVRIKHHEHPMKGVRQDLGRR